MKSKPAMKSKPKDRKRNKPDDLQRDGGGTEHVERRSKRDLDKELDKALADSFPSSDPPALDQPQNHEPAGDPRIKP